MDISRIIRAPAPFGVFFRFSSAYGPDENPLWELPAEAVAILKPWNVSFQKAGGGSTVRRIIDPPDDFGFESQPDGSASTTDPDSAIAALSALRAIGYTGPAVTVSAGSAWYPVHDLIHSGQADFSSDPMAQTAYLPFNDSHGGELDTDVDTAEALGRAWADAGSLERIPDGAHPSNVWGDLLRIPGAYRDRWGRRAGEDAAVVLEAFGAALAAGFAHHPIDYTEDAGDVARGDLKAHEAAQRYPGEHWAVLIDAAHRGAFAEAVERVLEIIDPDDGPANDAARLLLYSAAEAAAEAAIKARAEELREEANDDDGDGYAKFGL